MWIVSNFGAGVAAYIYTHWTVSVVVAAALISGIVIASIARHFRKQRTRIDQKLHSFCHVIRDDFARLFESNDGMPSASVRFEGFHAKASQAIAEFYREFARDSSMTCAIRLARITSNEKREYWTVGRSNGVEPSRSEHSVPISSEQGLIVKLRNADYQGVFIIPSIFHPYKTRSRPRITRKHPMIRCKTADLL